MTARVSFLFRVLIGGIFLIAGLAKIADPISFFSTLLEFRLFPDLALRFLAVYIPWLELILGLFLVLGIFHRTGALILIVLNVIFTAAIVSIIVRGIEVDCGCFGLLADMLEIPDTADYKTVIRNIIFISMCFCIFWIKETIFSLENYIKHHT